MKAMTLRNDDVTLTPVVEADIERIVSWCNDEQSTRWMPLPQPYGPDQAQWFIDHVVRPGWDKENELTWAIRAPSSCEGPAGVALGTVALRPTIAPRGQQSAEVGYVIHPDARGQGFTTAAVKLVTQWGMSAEGLDLARCTWVAAVGNWASRRVAWKCGFRVEGTLRGEVRLNEGRVPGWVGTLMPGDPCQPNEPWPADAWQ